MARRRTRATVRGLALLAAALLAGALLPAAAPAPSAAALSGSEFDAGNIISDEVFFAGGAMNAADIQSFLNARVVSCVGANGWPCLKDYRAPTANQAADAYCGAYPGGGNDSAAEIIAKVAVACSINPQVLIVLLQKEQGLVTSTSPTSTMYRSATGYGCPDTAACDTEYYGFFNQVYNAAHQFQRYTKTSSSWSYRPGRWNTIQWHPNAACGSSQVWIENQATANLYIYTPYRPNAAALANLYGTGDACSAYGNRNFWRYFNDWFGNPSNWVRSASFEGGSVAGWTASNGFINTQVYRDTSIAQDGEWFFATNTPVAGRALTQDIRRTVSVGESATTTIWVRSADGQPYRGTLAVWGLGGRTEGGKTDFVATGQWQAVTAELPVYATSHDTVRIDVYLQETGRTLWVDNASVSFGTAPHQRNLLANPSFEGSFAGWGPGYGAINQQVWRDPSAFAGEWFAAANTPVAGRSFAQDFPIEFRTDDVYTFSIALRSENAAAPMTGRVAVWALGGNTTFAVASDFSVGTAWTPVTTTIDLGSSGARVLKVEIYMDTVGSTLWLDDAVLGRNLVQSGSFEGGAFAWNRGPTMNVAAYTQQSSGIAPAVGRWFGATNTATPGTSLFQDIDIRPQAGSTYDAEIWVRSTEGTVNGRLAVWALGPVYVPATTSFTADGTWRKVRIPVPIQRSDHTTLRFEVYVDSTGSTLLLDGANLY